MIVGHTVMPLTERVTDRLNHVVSRALGTYEWRRTWQPAEYHDWAGKVETAAERLLSLLGEHTNNIDDAVEHLTSEPVWLDGFARIAAADRLITRMSWDRTWAAMHARMEAIMDAAAPAASNLEVANV